MLRKDARRTLGRLLCGLAAAAMLAVPLTALAKNQGDYEVDLPVIQGPDFDTEITVNPYKYSDGSAGFFKYIGATDAAKIANGEGVTGTSGKKHLQEALNNRTSTSSPFNIDAMRTAVDIIEQCNALRRADGIAELKIDPLMMAYSQVAAAWASHYEDDSAVKSNSHAVSQEFGIGENLAWNGSSVSGAFVQWYDNEKAVWESSTCDAFRAEVDRLMKQGHSFNNAVYFAGQDPAYKELYKKVGHYLNIINPQYTISGAGYSTPPGDNYYRTYEQSFTFSAKSSKTYTVAQFKQLLDEYCDKLESTQPHTVKVANFANGTASVSSTSAVQGTKITVTVTPDDLYYVAYDGVTVTAANGTKVTVSGTGNTYTFTMPSSDVTVNVKLEHQRRYAQFYADEGPVENGTVTVSPEAPQKVGETVTLTIKPDKGYQLGSISAYDCRAKKNLELSGTGNTRTFVMPDADVRLRATFVPATAHKVTVAKPDGGTVTLSSESALAGDKVTVTLAPSEGYELTSVSATDATGKSVALSGTGNTRTFTMPDADVSLSAVFTKTATAHKVTVAKPDGGTVTLSSESALAGDKVTVTLAPSEGYELTSVSATDATGKSVALTGTGNTRTFTMPDADVSLSAVFTKTAPEVDPDDGYLGFPDVTGDEWFATDRALGYAVEHGLIMGYEDGTFGAYDKVSRAQAVTVLWRMAGKPSMSSASFDDVPAGAYYAKAVAWARATKITSGYAGTNSFGPGDELTREMLAAFAASYARLQGIDTSGYEYELDAFSDAWKVSAWARSSMGWCVHEGIFSGVGDTGTIDPQGVADRSQLAKIVAVLHRDVLHLASSDEYTTEKNRQSALAANPSVIRSVPDTQNSEVVTLTGTVRRTFADYYFMGSPYPIYYLELPAEVTVTGTQYGSISKDKLILPDGFESYVGKTVSVRTQVSIRPTASIPEAQFTMLWCFNTTFQRVF